MSVMSDSVRPHRRQPTRLHRPWDSPGKNTGVGCHFLLQCRTVKSESEVAQSCPTQRPHGLQSTRLFHPWDFPGKSLGHTFPNILHMLLKRKHTVKWPCFRSLGWGVGDTNSLQWTNSFSIISLLFSVHGNNSAEWWWGKTMICKRIYFLQAA